MSGNGSDISPSALMGAIAADAQALDAASKALGKAIKDFADREVIYERALQRELIKIYHEAKKAGERVPAEDMRTALAHERLDGDVYGKFLVAKAQVDALKAWTRATESALSARQSLLSALRVELGAS